MRYSNVTSIPYVIRCICINSTHAAANSSSMRSRGEYNKRCPTSGAQKPPLRVTVGVPSGTILFCWYDFLLVSNCTRGSVLPPLLRLTPRWRGSSGTISVKFCTEVKGWLRYKTAKKYCWKFQPLSRAHERYRQTTDRPTCDSKYSNIT